MKMLFMASLLIEKVVMKSHPHPERPDRLRAIAASLATAGFLQFFLSLGLREHCSGIGVALSYGHPHFM